MRTHSERRSGSSWRTRDDGATAITVAILTVVLMGLAALVVDLGSLYTERARLETAADAAALAAVRVLPDTGAARTGAQSYAAANAPEAPVVSIAFYDGEVVYTAEASASDPQGTVRPALWRPGTVTAQAGSASGSVVAPVCYTPPVESLHVPDTVKITVTDPDAPLYFAKIWNKSATPVSASATARVESLTMTGVLPFSVVAKNSGDPDFGFAVGSAQDLQEGAGPGNYGWVTLCDPPVKDPGNNDKWQKTEFEDVMDGNGTDYPVYVTAYPGVTGEKTPYMRAFQDWYDRGNRVAVVGVILSSGPGTGRVQILGFARMRLTERPAKNDVQAVFVGVVPEEEMAPAAFWPYATAQRYSLIK